MSHYRKTTLILQSESTHDNFLIPLTNMHCVADPLIAHIILHTRGVNAAYAVLLSEDNSSVSTWKRVDKVLVALPVT